MKKLAFILTLLFVTKLTAKLPFTVDVSMNTFYTQLEGYGTWLEINGEIVWKPAFVGYNWQPYTNGRWVYTDYGWYWDSFEQFGWATCHYGRWGYNNYYGWVWYPDTEWGPAWVDWRYGDEFIGWAPLPPYSTIGHNGVIVYRKHYHPTKFQWRFVKYGHFINRNLKYYLSSVKINKHIWNRTNYKPRFIKRNRTFINIGIEKNFIERKSRRKIKKTYIEITNSNRKSFRNRKNSRVVSYRPVSAKSKNRFDNVSYVKKIRNQEFIGKSKIHKENKDSYSHSRSEQKHTQQRVVRNRELNKNKKVDRKRVESRSRTR